jgi:hypothetical protein
MRAFVVLAATAAIAVAGCTVRNTTVKQSRTPPPAVVAPAPVVVYQAPTPPGAYQSASAYGAPTISYLVGNKAQFDQAAVAAAGWCRSGRYGDARLVDRASASGGEVVTFACGTAMPVYRQPTTVAPNRSVLITYSGSGGFDLAQQKAGGWCADHFGNSSARLVSDDRASGRATFNCD